MKIGFVTPYDYPYPGGVTEHIRYLDRAFRALGHQTRIIAGSSLPDSQLEPNVIKITEWVVSLPFNGSTARIPLAPENTQRLQAVLEAEQFDILHLHEPATPFLNWAILMLSTAVKVGTFHAYIADRQINRFLRPLDALAAQALDGRILVSPALRDTLPRDWLGDYRIIPNGIDVARFANPHLRPIEDFADGRPNLLFVGRLDPRKGFPVLLKAYPAIKKAIPQVRLLVVGAFGEAEKGKLAADLQAGGLRDIHLIGRVFPEDLPRYHRTATLFCAPSLGGESFGIVLLEAMAAGLPLVASGIPGYRSLMTEGREGVFVPPNDPDALAGAVIRLLKDDRRQADMKTQGRITAARYDWGQVAPQILDYYVELLAQRRSSANWARAAYQAIRHYSLP